MNVHAVQQFVSDAIECYELVREFGVHKLGRRRWGNPEVQQRVLEFIPMAAASNYLFGARQAQKIAAMAIAGPTNQPSGLHSFHEGGKILFCYYALVHPQWRILKRGRDLLREMLNLAQMRFPECEALFYCRHDGRTTQEYPLGGVRWAVERAADQGDEGEMPHSQNSSESMRGPSRASRSPPSSTSSWDPPS